MKKLALINGSIKTFYEIANQILHICKVFKKLQRKRHIKLQRERFWIDTKFNYLTKVQKKLFRVYQKEKAPERFILVFLELLTIIYVFFTGLTIYDMIFNPNNYSAILMFGNAFLMLIAFDLEVKKYRYILKRDFINMCKKLYLNYK